MINKGLFSSNRQDWKTPKWLFNLLDLEFNFICDVASDDDNHLCDVYFTEKDNALLNDWYKVNYCNPPYKRKIQDQFILKAHEEALKGNITVMLIPARTDVISFHDIILKNKYEVRFLKGRLKFDDSKGTAPFPSMIVIFRK